MAPRRTKLSRRLAALAAAAVLVLLASLLAGVISAAHRDTSYRHTVDQAFSAEASALVLSSNATGAQLADVLEHPGSLGRIVLDVRLEALARDASLDSETAQSLAVPPPDAGAFVRLADTLRLRAEAVAAILRTVEGLLRIRPEQPAGSAGTAPRAAPAFSVSAASTRLHYAGAQLVLADRTYGGLPKSFRAASDGATLPGSRWTSRTTETLMPVTLSNDAASMAADPALRATIELRVVAVETNPLELPVGPGYPVTPTSRFSAAVSVINLGSAPSQVVAVIRVIPLGRSHGHLDSGAVSGVVEAGGAVALQLPTMAVAPGEHCRVTITIVRPRFQTSDTGLTWRRTVVVGQNPGR
jgi:hypothetical protein